MTDRIDIRDLVAMLGERVGELVEQLLPNGRRFGRQWAVGGVDGEVGQSLRIELTGERRGLWVDHASGDGGDLLSLIAEVQCGGDLGRAIAWASNWLRVGPRSLPRQPVPARPADTAATREEARRRAQGHWLSGSPIAGTLADDYLRCRGICLRTLGRQPGALRFHAEVRFQDRYYPALLAAVQGGDGRFMTCHRTLLQRRADGTVGKAVLPGGEAAKRLYPGAPLAGGFIPLWRGESRRPLRQAPATDRVAIAEGIEDGLTIAMADPRLRVLAAVAAPNMQALELPPQIREVLICADNDPLLDNQGRPHPARRAIERAIGRFQSEGRKVLLAYASSGAKDFNDRLMGAA